MIDNLYAQFQQQLAPKYQIEQVVGRGGMGIVFLALHQPSGERRAIKALLLGKEAGPDQRRLFFREVQSMRHLTHPNLVELLDDGEVSGIPFLVMKYCVGGSVADLVKRQGSVAADAAVSITMDALAGLAYCHRHGFVHRDIKPQNILLDEKGTARLGDFGLAKCFETAGLSAMTKTGAAWGSPEFMPVEQLVNYKYAKPTVDVFSMGATLYWLLAGQLPRDGHPRGRELLKAPLVPIADRGRNIPIPLSEFVNRSLAAVPAQRFPSAEAMLSELRGVWETL